MQDQSLNALQIGIGKFVIAGDTNWAVQSTQSGSAETFPAAVAVDSSGDAIVVGSFYQSVSLGGTTVTGYLDDMAGFAWKLDSSGTTDWAVAVGEVGTGDSSSSGSSGLTGVAVMGA